MKFSVLLNEKESVLLKNYMKENKIKSRAEAIRKCLKNVVNMVFRKNYDIKTDESLNKFYPDNDYYSNKIMD